MKRILIVVAVVVLSAISGGVGYALGTDNGLTQAQNIQSEFFRQRGTGQFSQGTPAGQGRQTQSGQGGNQPGTFGQRPGVAGTVRSVEGSTIQLTGQDGNTMTVKVDDKTTIQRATNATLADIKAGVRITVVGEQNGDITTARTIQIGLGGP
jgi:hypothetical protein